VTSYYAAESSDGRFGNLRGEIDSQSALVSTVAAMTSGDVLDLGGGTVAHSDIWTITNKSDLTIRNGTLVATDAAQTSVGVNVDNTSGSPTNRITFDNVHFRTLTRPSLTATYIPGNGTEGLLLQGGDGHRVKNCTFDGFRGSGMRVVDSSSNFVLTNNRYRWCRAAACWIGGGSFGGVVKGHRSYGPGDDGFCIDGMSGPRAHDITVSDLFHDGILPPSTTTGPMRPGTSGFSLLSCYNIDVYGFTIKNSGTAAFRVTVDSTTSPLAINNVRIGGYRNSSGKVTAPSTVTGAAWRNSSTYAPAGDVDVNPAILVFSNVSGVAVDQLSIEDVNVLSTYSPNWRQMNVSSGGLITNLLWDRVQGLSAKSTASNITQNTHYFDRSVTLV
jgi:hypothetical protein